jgi:hypothetical protein
MLEQHYKKHSLPQTTEIASKKRCVVNYTSSTSINMSNMNRRKRKHVLSRLLHRFPSHGMGKRALETTGPGGGRISKVVAVRACTCTLLSKPKRSQGIGVFHR